MDAGFLSVVEDGQYFMTNDTGDLVVNAFFQEKNQHHNRKDGSKETPKLDPYRKLQPVGCTLRTELRSELSLQEETILTLGSEFLIDQISL